MQPEPEPIGPGVRGTQRQPVRRARHEPVRQPERRTEREPEHLTGPVAQRQLIGGA